MYFIFCVVSASFFFSLFFVGALHIASRLPSLRFQLQLALALTVVTDLVALPDDDFDGTLAARERSLLVCLASAAVLIRADGEMKEK